MFKNMILMVVYFFWFSVSVAETINIGHRVNISSEIHADHRELLIYTPPSYHFDASSSYSVLYIMDADYNFHYVTGLIELLSSISSHIPEMLVVGLSAKGTKTYRKESKPALGTQDDGVADKTIEYLKKDVVPFIKSHYKVTDHKVLAGHSIGGMFTTHVMLNEPQLFDAYIAISPSLWWQDQAVRTHTLKRFEKREQIPANYYVSLGNEQGMGVHGFIELLQSKGPRSLNIQFKHFPDESHGSVGLPSYRWALQHIFADFKLKDRHFPDAQSVKDYAQLSEKVYGVRLPIASGHLRNTSYAHANDIKQVEAIEKALVENYPSQVDTFRNVVVEGLLAADKVDQAETILQRAVEHNPRYFETLANQSRLYQKQGKKQESLNVIEQAISAAQEANIRQWLMNELLEQKQVIMGSIN